MSKASKAHLSANSGGGATPAFDINASLNGREEF